MNLFGLQYFIKEYLIECFNKEFFQVPLEEVVTTYESFVKHTLDTKVNGTTPEEKGLALTNIVFGIGSFFFLNGQLLVDESFATIRERLANNIY